HTLLRSQPHLGYPAVAAQPLACELHGPGYHPASATHRTRHTSELPALLLPVAPELAPGPTTRPPHRSRPHARHPARHTRPRAGRHRGDRWQRGTATHRPGASSGPTAWLLPVAPEARSKLRAYNIGPARMHATPQGSRGPAPAGAPGLCGQTVII